MSINYQTTWHKTSFEQFLLDSLPQLLAERLPLASYQVMEDKEGENTCTVMVELSGGVRASYPGIPYPDEAGLFSLAGKPYVVVPLASQEELDQADITCAGEQLFAYVRERLGQASNGQAWDEEILRAWLPLDRWVQEFLQTTAMPLDTTNWLSRHTHLRRLLIPARERVVAPGQTGRVCPFETPEGPNIGRAFTVAVGAELRGRRLVIVDDRPEASLGLSASMLPFLEHNDPNRLLMAANMLRQAIPCHQPEPAWVQTGYEPNAPDFWCGHNLLTAFVSWGPDTSEDGILLSESAARRMNDPFPVEPGDKISNRHGSKGVVSRILPDEQMPHLPDGTPVELVYNFPGLRTRMHLGQVREAAMGRIARQEGAPVIVPPFQAPEAEQIRQRLRAAGLAESGMEMLIQGENGPALEFPSAVGWVYWSRLDHLARHKFKITLDDASANEYPPQLLDEMEFGVLKELGAVAMIREALTTRSERNSQFAGQAPARPPMFSDLAMRLQIAGIGVNIEEGKLTFRFRPAEGETLMLARPQPHPWMTEYLLEKVGAISKVDTSLPAGEYARLVEANQQLSRLLASQVPERLVREAESRLRFALNAFFAKLLSPENLLFRERQLFSGRTVVAPGIGLRLDQVGLPEEMCWKLFGSQIAEEMGHEVQGGPRNPRSVEALDALLARSWVIIHRAPTFSSTALLAFHPVREAGRVIRINPILCRWMNTDFDGDQVAFHLPQSEEAQQEAGELLSVAGQLNHNPALVKTLLPPPEVIWGLAWRSLSPDSRREITQAAGIPEQNLGEVFTQAALTENLSAALEQEGVAVMLEKLQALAQLGYAAVQASGASMSPFIGTRDPMPPAPESDDPETWEIYSEALAEKILSSTDYQDALIGPQLLDARARTWNRRSLPMVVGVRGVVTNAEGKPFIVRHNYAEGLTPEEMYACVVGARQGFAQIHLQSDQMLQEARKRSEPAGLNVLARARRARYPGIVFARAAASGEVDPLEDLDSRLMAGLV